MSDKRNADALRRAQGGDTEAAAQAIVGGARSADTNIVFQAVEAAVGSLDTTILNSILHVVANEISSREIDIKAGRETIKAGELHMPELGEISLGRLVSEVVNFVEKLESGDKAAEKLMRTKYGNRGWYRNNSSSVSPSAQIKNAAKVLKQAEGIMVSSSGKLRIYALKPADPEKARKKLDKRTKEIEAKIKNMEARKKATDKQLEEFERQKKVMEKERKATIRKLEAEKAKIEEEKGNL